MPLSYSDFVQTLRAFQESRVLLAAVELDLFTAVGAGGTAEEIASRCGADPRATEMLLNAVVAIGALAKVGDRYRNTQDLAAFLDGSSPTCERSALMHTVNVFQSWTTLSECVRAGTAVRRPGVEGHNAEWTEAFIAAMHRNAAAQASAVVEAAGRMAIRRLLDVGGGSGAYAIAFAEANPELRAEVFDLPFVLPIAERHIAAAGLSGRVSTRAADLTRDEFGAGYDLVLLSAICHMLPADENLDLLRRCARALIPGGRILVRDFILEPDKTAPKQAVLFALNMLVGTRAGATYTEAEYGSWLAQAGFGPVERAGADLLLASRS